MNEHAPIIDVTPINHSSSRVAGEPRYSSQRAGQSQGAAQSQQSGAYGGAYRYAQEQSGEAARANWSPASAVGGIVQMVVGAGLIAIGVPMLILPGPGLLSIAAGAFLVARGFGKVTGR